MKEANSNSSKMPIAKVALTNIVANKNTMEANSIETEIDRPKKIGLTIAFLVFGVFGLWSAFAPIEGAAHAPGVIKVKSYNKVIQHLEGGIVKTINVQNGDFVNAGDVLMAMDPTQSFSELEILNGQLLTFSALEARLMAERDGQNTINFPAIVRNSAAGQAEIDTQNHIFGTRNAAQQGSMDVLQQRIEQLNSRVTGLQALLQSKKALSASFKEEVDDFTSLLEEGFADKQRLRQLERSYAQAAGEAAELTATIASTEIQIGETRLQIIQEQNTFQNDVANQLGDTQIRLKDIKERITVLSDVVSRKDIRASIAGVITGLQVHTEGAVIAPGSLIAEIVPQSDDLIIEATVLPIDIDRVAVGQLATVRMSAFDTRLVPTLEGTVLSLSADALQDKNNNNASYYLARIELTKQSMDDLSNFELVPGMPAEVFISTGSRTLLQYLMKPLSNAAARGLRED